MAKKQMKIKRYSTSMGSGYQQKQAVKKLFGVVLTLAALLCVGYFGAPIVMNGMGGLFKGSGTDKNPPTIVQPTPSPTSNSGDVSSNSESVPLETILPAVKTNVYCEVLPSEIATKAGIEKKAEELKAKGVTTAVITLKNPEGKLSFKSETEVGKQVPGAIILDLKLVADTFKAKGISSCANVYTFMDRMAPTLDRKMAVKYVGTDYTWLDSAKELGGKPWANPASAEMQKYIYDITDEILSAGFKEIIYSAVQLPTGYSLDKRDFGATNDQLLAQLKGFINTVQTRVCAYGASAVFAFDFASANGGDCAKYIVSPTRLGAANIILTGKQNDINLQDAETLARKLKNGEDAERVSLWVTDGELELTPKGLDGYFVK
ncbi:MAG: putative glycoside hydrolase [Oscillospiraceae bacterium]